MTRILNLQRLDAIGVENAGAQELSTCSYLFCGNSTYSCRDCCGYTICDITLES